MEDQKLRYLQAFLNRKTMSLEYIIGAMKEWEERARSFYSEKIDLPSDEFLRMIVLDSCFIIEAITGVENRSVCLPEEVFNFQTDLILLENQLPYFVLDGIVQLAFPDEDPNLFLKCCIIYFSNIMLIKSQDPEITIKKVMEYLRSSGEEVKHLVDLLRICHLPSVLRPALEERSGKAKLNAIRNAADLQKAGMKFKLATSTCLPDIQYTTGTLQIPPLVVEECSGIVLTNIIILESCHYIYDSYVRDYTFFMHLLINTEKDVQVLVENKIIENWLGDNSSVADLFKNLGKDVVIYSPEYYYFDISQNLNAYCIVPRHKWRATFVRDYCSTPWMIASTAAAIILLILTFIQATTSIISL